MKTKILLMLCMVFLLVSTVSGAEWDNVKHYDPNTRTATVVNQLGLGETIAEARLVTPLYNKVAPGYQKVAEIEFKVYEDYNNALKELELYNIKDGMKKFTRAYEYKYLTYQEVEVEDYSTQCEDVQTANGTIQDCTQVLTGSHLENKEVWEKLTPADLKKNPQGVRVGIFTNVETGDFVEWVPNFFGIRVEEWASWTASLDVGLVTYYNLNSSVSNVVVDLTGNGNNGTNNGASVVTGKIENAFDFDGSGNYVDFSSISLPTTAETQMLWFKTTSTTDSYLMQLGRRGTTLNNWGGLRYKSNTNLQYSTYIGGSGYIIDITGLSPINDDNWHQLIAVYDGATMELFLDNVSIGSQAQTGTLDTPTSTSLIGAKWKGDTSNVELYFDGIIDEVGIWNRALNSTEISELYNSGNGLGYGSVQNELNITALTPENNTNYTVSPSTVNFSCYGSDLFNFTVMELYIDETLDQTNNSGLNDTIYNFSKSLTNGVYNWYCTGYNNESDAQNSSIRTLTIDSISYENATYNAFTFEGESNTIIYEIQATEINNLNGTLHYNGTDYNATSTNNGTHGNLSVTFIAPPTTTNENITFNFSYNLDGVDYNSSNYYQEVREITPIELSASCTDKALRFDLTDEQNASALTGDIEYNFKYGLTNSTQKEAYGSLTGVTTFYLCVNGTLGENYTLGYGEIQYRTSEHVDRRYYIFEGRELSNQTLTNITLRNLKNTEQTSFILELEDTSLNKYLNKYTALWRWYPALNEYKIVEMGKTDEDGQTVAHVDTEDVDYRLGLYELDGTLIKLGEPKRYVCTLSPCTFTLVVDAEELDYSSLLDVQAEITYNTTSGIFTLIYNDPNQYTSLMRLEVTRETGTDTLLICNSTSTEFTGVLSCDTSAYTGFKRAVAYRSASPEAVLAQKTTQDTNRSWNSSLGLFISILLWLAVILSGLGSSPVLTVILSVVALIPALVFGAINFAIFTGIAVLGAIVLHFIKRALAF